MPFRSKAQRKYLYAKHPEIAKRWSKKYDPEIVKKAREMTKGGQNAR